ncbi:hypothetical protein I3760_16G030200 [Carya illinoinensis]|uniref:Uncharacterized protein n=1 Tax=Carya illinoinensis TaxID=32201 RepID=A0A922D0V2_CARIL|nr:hypothetical protein I3760_16G030200 [Carya illinoinensis]KAG6671922.1 hypothetical protein I3842_16G028600 [Carya illinoinensis]
MKVIWAGSRHTLELSDCISRLVASDPVIFSTSSVFFFFRPIGSVSLDVFEMFS